APANRWPKANTARRRWCGAVRSIPSACSAPTRCWSAATPRAAPITRGCASAAALPRRCRWPATSWCACATTGARACSTAGLGVVKEKPRARRQIIRMHLNPDEDLSTRMVKVSVRPECFTGEIDQFEWPQRKPYDEFDFGYVLTVHKAQGSQWDDVVLFDE